MLFKRCKGHDPSKCRCPFWYVFELHGSRYRRSTRTANKQTAGRIEERRRVAVLEGRDEEDQPKITLKAHINDYVAHTKKENKTAYKDEVVLARLLDSVGDRMVSDVSPFHIERWKQRRADDVSKSTVNRELNIVRGCFSRAVEWGRVPRSPLDPPPGAKKGVCPYDTDDVRIRVLSDDELRHLLTYASSFTQFACRVTLECLPRLSEVLGIKREHIGPTWIEIRRKGGSVERVPVNTDLRQQLIARAHKSGYVFGEGEKGNPPTEQSASVRIIRELRRLGIQNASHHTMRHTGVTLMLEAGRNPRAIQRLAGWSSLRMLERYGHARDTEILGAVASNADYLATVAAAKPKEKTAAKPKEKRA